MRHKLHVGFASLNSLPFASPDDDGSDQTAGDTELDPRAAIMLTSLRGGVSKFDCPAPPSIEGGENGSPSDAEGTTCWDANRRSEIQISDAFDRAWEALLEEDDSEATRVLEGEDGGAIVTCRLGYRSAVVLSEEEAKDAMDDAVENDCTEREGRFEGDARVGILFAGKPAAEGAEDGASTAGQPAVALIHNLSEEYVLHSLRSSPLVRRYKIDKENTGDGRPKNVRLISLAHNPETQVAAHLTSNHHKTNDGGAPLREAREHMRRALTSAFVGYEIAVEEGLIDGYGVDSNGLSLPESHDMHLGWRDVLECAVDARLEVRGNDDGNGGASSSLRTIRLPGNLLETRGLDVAEEILSHHFAEGGRSPFGDGRSESQVEQEQKLRRLRHLLPKSLDVCVTRPLTAYPHGGTGRGPTSSPGLSEGGGGLNSTPPMFLKGQQRGDSGGGSDGKNIDATHPIRILDYQIETAGGGGPGEPARLVWSNRHFRDLGPRPAAYQPVLNASLSHFDADAILEASRERELTVEERETLDGCKLLRDMLHDLDSGLDTVKSFAAYEEYLMNVAVPLIYGTFEELDEDSARMLQLFFGVHGTAVRMAVARWTRELLLAGRKVDEGGNWKKDEERERRVAEVWNDLGFGGFDGGYDVPEDATLQEYALERLLKDDAVRSLVVGCSRPEHVLEAMRAADSSDGETER